MAKYTDEQLKDKATDVLYFYHMGDQRADILIHLMCQFTGAHPNYVVAELNKLADKEIEKDSQT